MMTISRVCAAALAFATLAALAEAAPRIVHVAFKGSATEAAVKGRLRGAAVIDYVFPAKTGETIAISLRSDPPGLGFTLTAPENHELTFQAGEFRGVAPLDGDYKISVMFLRSEVKNNPAAAYTLTISHETVEPAEQPEQGDAAN